MSALTTDTLEAGHSYQLELRLLTSTPTPQGTASHALEDATCTAGAVARTLHPGIHECPIAWDNARPYEDVLYFDSVSHASHVTLPVAVAHAP